MRLELFDPVTFIQVAFLVLCLGAITMSALSLHGTCRLARRALRDILALRAELLAQGKKDGGSGTNINA